MHISNPTTSQTTAPKLQRPGRAWLVLCAFVTLSLVLINNAAAGTLAGQVLTKDGTPKPNVRVDLLGPDKKVLLSNSQGKFNVSLSAGYYTVRITDANRQMNFPETSIPASGTVTRTFQLKW